MPAPATAAEFAEYVRKSELVPEDRLRRALADGPLADTVEGCAQAFVAAGLLTKFQARQVKLGRYKRFEIAGKYRLLELLGIGGMGAVYLCEHKFMKRLVALKVLPVEKLADPSALMRFYREARAVAALDHPNIVRAYDIDTFEKMHFLVMEYVDGASIHEVIARHGPLAPERAANYIMQAAHGLHHAGDLGMVHRDIKPGNLLLERTGIVKILDMGLARFFDQSNDNVTEKFDNNCVLGTADYLAPEQAVSSTVDIRADIYALGGTFYFMLTGQSPFPDGTIAHKLMCHQNEEPAPISDFRSDVRPEFLVVLDRMMRKDPSERYQTPAELYEALAAIVGEELMPPPASEMPELCPAVLALTGPALDRSRVAGARLAATRTAGVGPGTAIRPALQASISGPSSVSIATGPRMSPSTSPILRAGAATKPNSSMVPRVEPRPVPRSARSYLILGMLGGAVLAVILGGIAAAVWLLMLAPR